MPCIYKIHKFTHKKAKTCYILLEFPLGVYGATPVPQLRSVSTFSRHKMQRFICMPSYSQ